MIAKRIEQKIFRDSASNQVNYVTPIAQDKNIIKEFRQHAASDEQLVGTTPWGSYVATRKVASWLHAPS